VDLIDLVRGRWKAVGLGAVALAGLAAGLLGLAARLALGEGGGLPLAGAGRLVELAAEALVFGLQVAEASLKGLAAGTRDGLHTSIIGGPSAATALPSCGVGISLSWTRYSNIESLVRYSFMSKGEKVVTAAALVSLAVPMTTP
jgi:hypothetical protein